MGRRRAYGSDALVFVTRRKCVSYCAVIAVLCLLSGFLLGRFVSDKTIAIQQAHMLQDLNGNGLAKTIGLQDLLLESLNRTSFHETPDMIPDLQLLQKQDVNRTEDLFKDLSLLRLNVEEISNCTVATICGTQEQDRYVVLSASGEGYDIAYKVAKAFDELFRKKSWEPKRTIIFCVFLSEVDNCMERILDRIKPKIVGYIAVHGKAARGYNEIIVSGSGMVQATMLDTVEQVRSFNGYELNIINSPRALPRLNIDIPHVLLSFIDENRTADYTSENQKTLAEIVGLTMFRLSEEVFFKWNPKYFSEIMNTSLNDLESVLEVQQAKDNLTTTVTNLIADIESFNSKLEETNVLESLEVRMINDKLLDLDRALLCPDPYSRSKTDFVIFKELSPDSPHNINMRLNNIKECYEAANEIILDSAQCRHLTKDSNFQ